MNAKKGKKGKVEPEPEPEVPVVHEPTEEELEAERIAQQEEKKRMNRDRVLFAKPVVKHIVSHHSGTVLAEEEPRTPLDSDLKATATKVFDALATDGVVDMVLLPELLKECGFIASAELLQKHIPRFCNLAMKKIQLLKNETAKAIEEPSIVDREIAGERNNVSSTGSEGGEPEQLSKQEFLCFLEIFHASAFHFGARLRKFAARNQLREVEELLVRNCPANTGNGEGLTPLHYCCEYGRPEVIELLHSIASKSLVVDAQDRYGWTPLHCAAHQGNKDCVRLLLQYGADVTKVNREGKSALHLAAAQNRAAIVQMLLEAGADANLQDQVGMTPVHESTYRGHFPLYNEFARQPHVETDTLDILKRTAADYIDKPPMSASASSRRVKTPIK